MERVGNIYHMSNTYYIYIHILYIHITYTYILQYIYILPYVKQIASGNLLYNAGSSNRCSVTTLRGGIGWEVGRKFKREVRNVYLWLIPVGVSQKPTQYCKAIIFQLIINRLKRERESTCHCRGHGFSPWSEKIAHAIGQLSP